MAECLLLEQSVLPASGLSSTAPLRAAAPKEARHKSSCKELRPAASAPGMPRADLPTPAPCRRRAVRFLYLLDPDSEQKSMQKSLELWVFRTFYRGAERRKTRSSPTACRHKTTPRCWDPGHRSALLSPKHTKRNGVNTKGSDSNVFSPQ